MTAPSAQDLPPPPGADSGSEEPVFAEPWQAQVFAMTVALHERGYFDWTEWASHLAQAIRDAQAQGDPDDGSTYYRHWLLALERLLVDKGLAQPLALTALRQAWRVAAEATPHGRPVQLGPGVRAMLGGRPAGMPGRERR